MLYSIRTFGGMLPRVEPRLLQDKNAQVAFNTKLRSGAATPFFKPSIEKYLDAPTTSYQTLYLHEFNGDNLFLTFENDVDIVRGPIANDQYNRSYITGLDVPRVFDNTLLTSSTTTIDSTNSYKLAIPVGDPATMATNGAGTGDEVTRAYVYTYLREWSDGKTDEGQPSDPATISGQPYIDIRIGDTVTVSGIEDCPDQAGNNVSLIALYRAVTSALSVEFQLVIQFDIAEAKAGYVSGVTWNAGTQTFSYTDSLNDEDLGEVIPSTNWAAPISGLKGLRSLRNGSLAAFKDNVVYFTDVYQPHAWPTAYQVTLDYPIVGLGAFGNTIVALTEVYPILINAQDPTSLIAQPTQSLAPCVSKKGIVEFENNVYFPSISGLFKLDSRGITNLTQDLYTYDTWAKLAPETFVAAVQDGRFYAHYNNTTTNDTGMLIIDLREALAGASLSEIGAVDLVVDPVTDELYYLQHNNTTGWVIFKWEGLLNSYKNLSWKSKIFLSQGGPANFSAARVRAEFFSDAELAKINADLEALAEAQQGNLKGAVNEVEFNLVTFNGDIYQSLYPNYSYIPELTFRFYQDGALKLTKTITSDKPFRLPAGIVGTRFEVEIEGNVPVYQLDIATSMRELQ